MLKNKKTEDFENSTWAEKDATQIELSLGIWNWISIEFANR